MKKCILILLTTSVLLFSGCQKEETITYQGKEYKKSEVTEQTWEWLQLSDEERIYSSYAPMDILFEWENNLD